MHLLKHKPIHRRTVLRGLATGGLATLALPTLEAMVGRTARAGGTDPPLRFMTWFFGNGVGISATRAEDRFEPTATGPEWALSEQLEPLAGVKDYINLCTGLSNPSPDLPTHHEGMVAFTGSRLKMYGGDELASDPGGPTIDQMIAETRGPKEAPISSLQIGVSRRLSVMDGGTTLANLSHRGGPDGVTAQPPQFNPQAVWQQMFGFALADEGDKTLRQSVLDLVRGDVRALERRLGAADRLRLDEHLDGVRELEKKIEATFDCTPPEEPEEDGSAVNGIEPVAAINDAMVDLLAYAFECDLTRVASLLFTGGAAETVFTDVGATVSHHEHSHTSPAPHHEGVLYIMRHFAAMLERFANTQDFDGSNLLDNMIILCSSDCSQGWSHSVVRQPMLLAGRGGGYLEFPGTHFRAIEQPDSQNEGNLVGARNTSDVLLTCLHAFDPSATEVGDDVCGSSDTVDEVLA